MLKRKSNFEKKYPLFATYIIDENIRTNMLYNKDLLRKYEENKELIILFIEELEQRFNKDIIKNLIIETIVKLPDNILISLIKSYLSSSEEAKNNEHFLKYYNLISNYGIEAINYMETNGITTNRSYRNIPNLIVDSKYESITTSQETFKDTLLKDIFYKLKYTQKKFVVYLLENNMFQNLDNIFDSSNISLMSLFELFMVKGIDENIININTYNEMGAYHLKILIYTIFAQENTFKYVDIIKYIIKNKRYNILKEIINSNRLNILDNLEISDLESLTDEEVLSKELKDTVVLTKQQN